MLPGFRPRRSSIVDRRIWPVENRTTDNMITRGGPECAGVARRLSKGCCKADVSSNLVGTVSSTVRDAPFPPISPSLRQLLRPEPAVRTGAPIGCAWVSTPASCSTVSSAPRPRQAVSASLPTSCRKTSRNGPSAVAPTGAEGESRTTDWDRSDLVVAFADTSASSQVLANTGRS
jgi:hypothetical protein